MKHKVLSVVLALTVLCGSVGILQAGPQRERRGGLMGFVAGCCFGIRAGAAYNDGKEIHWREWVMLIPYANIVFMIWNGVDGANGMTSQDYVARYGSTFY